MLPANWTESDVAVNTIICATVFSAFAVLSITIFIVESRKNSKAYEFQDYMTFTAFALTIILVGQTIWAVVDEGQGQHASRVEPGKFEVTAKVGASKPENRAFTWTSFSAQS